MNCKYQPLSIWTHLPGDTGARKKTPSNPSRAQYYRSHAFRLAQPTLCRKLNRSNVCIGSLPNKFQHPIRTNNSVKRYHHQTNNHQHSTLLHLKEEKANDPQNQ
ncbi:hypothetical protein AAHE18_17G202200 [Arachis hypogaea]